MSEKIKRIKDIFTLSKAWTIALLLLPLWLSGQNNALFSKVEYITSDNGLSQNEVTCILQDQKGFIWVGTRGGLNRFDGLNFKVFQNELGNINSLSNNSIESLYEDNNGNIWIGTKSNGLSKYNPKNGKFTHYTETTDNQKGIRGNRVISISEGEKGVIWIGTWFNGLTLFDYEKNTYKYLLPGTKINRIYKSKQNKVWVASVNFLFEFSLDGTLIAQHPYTSAEFLEILEVQNSGRLFLGTWNNGIIEFDTVTQSFHKISIESDNGNRIKNVYRLHQDNQEIIWIGSWNGGLSRFDLSNNTCTIIDLSAGTYGKSKELYRDVLSIFQDKFGVFWFGTNGGGLCKADNRQNQFGLMSKSTSGNGLPEDPIWSIFKDSDNVLWVGEKGSEYIYYSEDGITFSSLLIPRPEDKIQPETKLGIRTIFQDNEKNIWAASNQSLYKITKDKNNYKISVSLINVVDAEEPQQLLQVSSLYQTSDGIFWVGLQQRGLKRSLKPGNIDDQIFKTYLPNENKRSIKSNRVSALLEDKSGRFWIGTYNGLHLFRPFSDDFIHFGKDQENIRSLSSNIIISLHEDKKGNLWVGTPNGLNLAIPGINQEFTFKCYQEKEGLPNNYIHSILEDNKGNLWISTNKGISRFNPNDETFYNYNVNDGLQSNSFMEGVALEDKNGLFYFGGINGLNVFHPDSIKETVDVPEVVFTAIKVFNTDVLPGQKIRERVILNETIEYTKDLTLTHRENVFSIDFVALNFSSPGNNQYKYRMAGLEDQWYNAGNQTSITYSNLGSGNYTFQVKAADNSGNFSEAAAELKINILPPFWATWQAFLFYALGFAGLLLLYKRFIDQQNALLNKLTLSRLEREKEIELAEVKTQFFTNITHELRTPLTLITGPVEVLLEDKNLYKEHKGHLHTIQHHSKRLLNLVNQLMDFRKAESGNMKIQVAPGNIVKYVKEIFLSFKDLADQKNILFQFNVSHKKVYLFYDRKNMEIVLCNLLSNAFKYTCENGKITVSINKIEDNSDSSFPDGYCEIIVEDNGEGMSEKVVDKIFDRYYQIGKTNSVNLIGTGIGLALVKNIVELHSGSVRVESVEEKGSKFVVKLPLGTEQISPELLIKDYKNSEHISHYRLDKVTITELENDPGNSKNESTQTILIVEDNNDIRTFVKQIFYEDYHVIEAENGKDGLLKAEKYIPDIIISDVMMPEMDGHTLCKYLKSNDGTSHIPVVMLTARTTNVYKVEGFQAGADAYVTKPFQPSVLKANVESLLLSRQKLREQFSKLIKLEPTEIEITCLDEKFLKAAIELVEENLASDNLNRDFLAKSLALSPSSLYRKLKSLTGFTTNAFVRSIRLKRAAQMMKNSDYNISEIAYQVGFNDLKYFRISFKEQFGVNPSEYAQNESDTADMKNQKTIS